MDAGFFLNSALIGVGLAMDAFSVSVANGLADPGMRRRRMCIIAGTYAFFQFLMPVTGWFCVHTIVSYFQVFQKMIPWIAFGLLLWIGGGMLLEGVRGLREKKNGTAEVCHERLSAGTLLLQGVATSIDALSVGFTIAEYDALSAFVSALIIAAVTFGICMSGLLFGKRFGRQLSEKAPILGGCILLFIGAEILIKALMGA